MPYSARRSGFILLETAVAFVIMALSFAIILAAGTDALRASSLAARYQEATLRAQSHLQEAVHAARLMPGEWSGEERSGYGWRVRIAPSPLAVSGAAPLAVSGPASLTLYTVDVWESWRDGLQPRQVHLESEQIAASFKAP